MEPTNNCRLCRVRPTLVNECVCAACLHSWLTWKAQKRELRRRQAESRAARAWRKVAPLWAIVAGGGNEL